MVRAAVAGAVDYSRADPRNRHWRIRHRLILDELQRADDQKLLEYSFEHWCAYISHGGLKEASFKTAKETAVQMLQNLQEVVWPWNVKPEKTGENSTIDNATQKLIDTYRQKQAGQASNVPQQQK